MIALEFQDTKFRSEFSRKVAATKNPKGMLMIAGRELGNRLRSYFRSKDRTDVNKLNPARREHFWLKVGQSVQAPVVDGNTVSVTITDPRFAQKVFGGRIVPKNASALTIPVSPEAYGRTAKTFESETGLKLFIVRIGGTKANKFENAVLAAKRDGKLEIEYVLRKSVNQKADPDALPQKSALEAAILARAEKVLQDEVEEA